MEIIQYDAFLTFALGALHIQSSSEAVDRICFLDRNFPGARRPMHLMLVDDAPEVLQDACRQLLEYFAGTRQHFTFPLALTAGSEFQRQVWTILKTIPYGTTWSYSELAARVAKPDQNPLHLARAVGRACAANPLPIVIPCHRVIGKNGRLTGFTGGVAIKEYLLNHEMLGL
jgi:O-6-methylguanine DNA methyltransferase